MRTRTGTRTAAALSARQLLLRDGLDRLRARYGARHLGSDPLEYPRRYDEPEDRELVGLLAAGLAFGNVTSIRNSLERLCPILGPRPVRFVRRADRRELLAALSPFRHRWIGGRDVACLLHWSRAMRERSGSIGAFFREGYVEGDMAASLASFRARALALDHGGAYTARKLPADARVRYFFPSPSTGACKRTNMYLRWMARPDDGVDLGLWPFVRTRDLVIPLDTHIYRIGARLGWTRRRTPGWKAALDITRKLLAFDPEDPVKYDFALSRMGILHNCPRHRRGQRCELCELARGRALGR